MRGRGGGRRSTLRHCCLSLLRVLRCHTMSVRPSKANGCPVGGSAGHAALDGQYRRSLEAQVLSRDRIGRAELDWRQNVVERATKRAAQADALASLAEIQRTRPLKPPGRS